MKSCRILVPYFGPWPAWFPLYLKSCGYNPGINWLIIGDSPAPREAPENVAFLNITLVELLERIGKRLGIQIREAAPYKLCDYRPAFGEVFEEEIEGYDFFGWGDIDLVYGQLEKMITPLLGEFDIFSFSTGILSNHTFIMRRTPGLVSLFREASDWKEQMELQTHTSFDDHGFDRIVRQQTRLWMHECYVTPYTKMPWVDGTYRFPSQWTWNRGVVTNNLEAGYQFIYFHFMLWKGGNRELRENFAQWSENIQLNFNEEDYSKQSDTYIFTNAGLTFQSMKQPRMNLPFMNDMAAPKPTFLNKLYRKLRRNRIGFLGPGFVERSPINR